MMKILRIKKIRTFDLPLEKNTVTSKLEAQNLSTKTCDSNAEIMFTQTTDPNKKSEIHVRKNFKYCLFSQITRK